MKKHLIAAAVAAALVAPAAMAQVTVYGILDINWQSNGVDSDADQSRNSAMGSNSLATSRLGFRGSEDLGGGLKAEFQLEGKITPETGTVGSSDGTTFFDRESWAGLTGNFGHIRLGLTDVSSSVNIDSKVSQAGDLALSSELSTDKKKVVRYISPNMNGFVVEAGYANPDSTTTNETSIGKITNLYASYEKGPLGLYIGHEDVKVNGSVDQRQTNLGVKYNFGVASVGLTYQVRDAVADTGSASADGKDLDIIIASVAVPLSQGYTLHGVYKNFDRDDVDSPLDNTAYTVALTKAMSKRTTLYAAYISTDFDKSTGSGFKADTDNFVVGIQHNF